ncbi:MAG: hypothetical protein M3N46_12680, partial [Actinomycetota bacterium]|nr:hypothetical protein [Actinomycetota bacterium]
MSSRPSRRPRRLLLGGIAVPAALVGSMLGATSANAAGSTETTKAGLVAAFQSASNGYVVTLGADLLGDGGASDVLTVPNNRSVTLDLNGHRLGIDRVFIGSTSYLRTINSAGVAADLVVGGSSVASNETVATGVQVAAGGRLEVESGVQLTSIGSDNRAGIGTIAGSTVPAL